MALSRNLQQKRNLRLLSKRKAIKNLILVIVIAIPVAYGILNLAKLRPKKPQKEELKVETGDRPIEKKIKIVVRADGGLNLRKEPDVNSERIGRIPDKTKLEAKKELNGWYNVDFEGKNGWISKEFTVLEGEEKPDITDNWLTFDSSVYGFSVKYPRDWNYKDYGQGGELLGFVAFSFSELPDINPQGSPLFIPIEIKLSMKSLDELKSAYDKMPQKVISEVDISGIKGVKYVYSDTTDSTEKTKVFFSHKGKSYIVSENGGYGEDLDRFLKTMVLK